MDDGINVAVLKSLPHDFTVTNIPSHEPVARMLHDICEAFQISGVGKLVICNNGQVRARPQQVAHKVATNEAGASSDEHVFHSIELEYCVGIVLVPEFIHRIVLAPTSIEPIRAVHDHTHRITNIPIGVHYSRWNDD